VREIKRLKERERETNRQTARERKGEKARIYMYSEWRFVKKKSPTFCQRA